MISLHEIMGFLKPDKGESGLPTKTSPSYAEPDLERIRKKVTMVFQNGALFDSLTVGENVAFPLRERGGLEEEQIYQIIDGLPTWWACASSAICCPRIYRPG